jgi:hypothetical protein
MCPRYEGKPRRPDKDDPLAVPAHRWPTAWLEFPGEIDLAEDRQFAAPWVAGCLGDDWQANDAGIGLLGVTVILAIVLATRQPVALLSFLAYPVVLPA